MGIPSHYSLELPNRCLTLIEELWPVVADGMLGKQFGGPLTTTFLLALATPMITLPIERLLKPQGDEGTADDRRLDPYFAEQVHSVFHQTATWEDCPFFSEGDGWSYVWSGPDLKLARGLPNEIADALSNERAAKAAARGNPETLIKVIRNALAHGAIAYLDDDGRTSFGGNASMLAFVGDDRRRGEVVGLHILRISESGFRSFLHRWVKWLNDSKLVQALAA